LAPGLHSQIELEINGFGGMQDVVGYLFWISGK
jgi:hypothetical protein